MLVYFTYLADWLTYSVFALSSDTHLSDSVHFFIEDTTKIMVLLVVMIYAIAYFRAALNVEIVRDYLKNKHPLFGYIIGSMFGAITPFCSCSSIPLFLGFTTARIPLGVTMSFLITSPMINEVAIVLLGGVLGWKFTIAYATVGILVGISGGFILDILKADRFLKSFVKDAIPVKGELVEPKNSASPTFEKLSHHQRHLFAKRELSEIFGRVWKWILIGVGVGALLHGFVPSNWVFENLGQGQWWTVPSAVLLGIPLYANATGIIPVIETLLGKGLPVGTALALMMSVVGASFPEFVMLKQVMEWKLLTLLFGMFLVFFTLIGWFFNFM